MPMTKAAADPSDGGIPAYGTLIQVSSSANSFVTIEGVGDITGPANSMAEVDVTSHSTGVPIKQTIPGLIDLGDISFPCFWIPGEPTQAPDSPYGLEYLFFNRIRTTWQLIAPDPTRYTRQFRGFVKTLGEDYKIAGVMTRNVAIRITSPMTSVPSPISLTPASAPSVPATGQPTGTFSVKSGGSLAMWSAVSSDPSWLTVSSPAGLQQGDASVTYAVAPQTAGQPARNGTITISGLGLVFHVSQVAG